MPIVRERRQFSVGPIGVARASSGGQQVSQGIANFAGTVGEIMYREAAKKAHKTGVETGMGAEREDIITIDPSTGKPKAYEVPEGFGAIAADAYQSVVLDRFQSSINEEIKLKAQELAAKYQDPKTFGTMLNDYVVAMASNSEGMFEEYITNTGNSYRRSTEANLVAAKIAKERTAASQSILTNNNQASEEVYDLAAAGDYNAALAMVDHRAGITANGVASGLLKGGSDIAVKDDLSVSAVAGILQNVLKGASDLQNASVATYLMTQGLEGGEHLSDEQMAALSLVRPYVTRNNTSDILGAYSRIQKGYAAISQAKVAERKAEIDAEFAKLEMEATEILLGQIDADTSAQNIATGSMSAAFNTGDAGVVAESITALGIVHDQYSENNDSHARRGSLTEAQALDLNRDHRQSVSAGILFSIGAQVTEAQKQKLADYLFSGDETLLAGIPSAAASGIYKYRNSGLYRQEDHDFAADLMSKSVSDLRNQAEINLKQFGFTQEAIRIQGAVRNGTVTEADFKDFGIATSTLLNEGVIDDSVASNAYRSIGLSQGKYIASSAGSGASSLQLTALSAYVASAGKDDQGLSEYLREAGDKIISSVNEEDLAAASNHVNGMAEDRRKIEAAVSEQNEKAVNIARVSSGFGDPNSKDDRELSDEVLNGLGISLFDPDLLNDKSVYAMMKSAPSQELINGLKTGVSGAPSAGFDVLMTHFDELSNSPEGFGKFVDRFGAALSAKDKQFLINVSEIASVTGESPSSVAADLYQTRSRKDIQAVVSGSLGGRTPQQFLEKKRSGYTLIPEAASVVEYWAGDGLGEDAILDRLDNFVDRSYGKRRGEDRFVYDPISGWSGYTRGNLELAFPDGGERSEFIRIVDDHVRGLVDVDEYPNGLTLTGAGQGLSAPKKAWLSPVPDAPLGMYTLVTTSNTGLVIPVILDGEDGPEWIGFSRGDTEPYRIKKAEELKAEAARLQAAEELRQVPIREEAMREAVRLEELGAVMDKYYPED